ncbi:MAG: hypothetical protein KJO07_00785 [Deltaproteobacteria bacterium]|nr:hypothetical protein [Deltaproteobacteria bacterium]
MSRLAQALAIKRPTLHYYFPDRVAIFEQALADQMAAQVAFVVARMAEHDHPIDQLYAQICAVHDFHHGNEDRVVFLTQALGTAEAERTRSIVSAASQAFELHRQAMAASLQAGIASGTVADCDVDALLLLTRGLVDGLLVQRVVLGADLAPAHRLFWERVLAPLKLEPDTSPTQDQP